MSDNWRDFPLPDGTYSDDCRPFSQQDVVNYLPTFAEAEGTRSRIKYRTCPGLQHFANVEGPHRGGRDVEGKTFVVSGRNLYQVNPNGTSKKIGVIPGTGFVSMTHNQIAGGNQLVIATGDNSYVYNTVTEVLTATGVALVSVDFLNQRILGVDQARRFWRYSGVATATSWEELDNESAESSPDRIVGGIVSQGEWLVFGERTIEVFANSPTEATAFQRTQVIEKGCASAQTICRLDNSVFFVGNDGVPYRLNGYTPVPIAPKAIIDAISQSAPKRLYAFTWEDRGYAVYYVTAQDGQTFGYDVTTQRWHRRESYGYERWRINTLFKSNGVWYAGDAFNQRLYKLEWGYVYEGCEIMPRKFITGVMHDNGNRVRVSAYRMTVATGGKPSVKNCPDPPPPPPSYVLIAPDNQLWIAGSETGGSGSYVTFSTGHSVTSSETLVDVANGAVFHWLGGGNMRASFDRMSTFSAATGIPSQAPSAVLHTGTEYLAFAFSSVLAAADGLTYASRYEAACRHPVRRGATILGIAGGQSLAVSSDTGATFASYVADAGINATEGIQSVASIGTKFVIAANNASSQLMIGRSGTGLSGSWVFDATFSPATPTAICHGLVPDKSGNLLMVLKDGTTWVSSNEGALFTQGPSVPYAGAATYPTAQRNKLSFHKGYFYFGAAQGGGVNHVYRIAIGGAEWELVYDGPASASIDSISALP